MVETGDFDGAAMTAFGAGAMAGTIVGAGVFTTAGAAAGRGAGDWTWNIARFDAGAEEGTALEFAAIWTGAPVVAGAEGVAGVCIAAACMITSGETVGG